MKSLIVLLLLSLGFATSFRHKMKQDDNINQPLPPVPNNATSGPGEAGGTETGAGVSPAGATAITERIIGSPYYWCWYPCYCWSRYYFTSISIPPICWCWYPCGCWWGRYYLMAARDEGISTIAARGAGGSAMLANEKPEPPKPTGSPPTEDPSF
jgi:hypothetical protein